MTFMTHFIRLITVADSLCESASRSDQSSTDSETQKIGDLL